MPVAIALWCIAALLVLAVVATAIARKRAATPIVYGVSLAASLVALASALQGLLGAAEPTTAALPLGRPWRCSQSFLSAIVCGGRGRRSGMILMPLQLVTHSAVVDQASRRAGADACR
jgi:hypothetical protein